MKFSRLLLGLFLVLIGLFGQAQHVQAQWYEWKNDVNGNWSDTTKWDPAGFPDATGKYARILKNATVYVDWYGRVSGMEVGPNAHIYVDTDNSLWFSSSPPGPVSVTNNGMISTNGYYDSMYGLYYPSMLWAEQAGTIVNFMGSGRVRLGYTKYDKLLGYGIFINHLGHTIEGGGLISSLLNNYGTIHAGHPSYSGYKMIFDNVITNEGEIQVEKGTLQVGEYNKFTARIAGKGTISVLDGGIFKSLNLTEVGDFIMSEGAQFEARGPFRVYGNLSFSQDMNSTPCPIKWNNYTVEMVPSSNHTLEACLKNWGDNLTEAQNTMDQLLAAGSIYHLKITGEGTITLVDLFDNGNRSSPEALYVSSLELDPDATLNLGNISLYTMLNSGELHRVLAGDGELFGGGSIVNVVVPLPSTLWLLGSGLLGLPVLGRRLKISNH